MRMSSVVYPPRWAYWTILMFHLSFKILGFSTISLHDGNPKEKRPLSFARSKFGIVYNLLLFCGLVGLSFVSLPRLYFSNYVNKTTITVTIEMVQSLYGVLMMYTILLYYAFKWSTLKMICNYLVQVEGQFRFFREQITFERTLRVLLAVHATLAIMLVMVVVSEELAFHNGPLGWCLDSMPTIFVAYIVFQYFSAISLMTLNIARTNHALENICRSTRPEDYSKSLNRCRRVFVNCALVQSLRYLRNIYDDFSDVCNEISQFYSFPALIIVPYTIYSLFFNLYYLLQPLFDEDMDFDPLACVNTIVLIICLIYPLGVLTSKVTHILEEIEKAGVIVHSLLKNTIDREAKSELKKFTLKLLHRQIKFTASEYFNLDNSLLRSVISSVLTYVVILIQFQIGAKSSQVCSCNCTRL